MSTTLLGLDEDDATLAPRSVVVKERRQKRRHWHGLVIVESWTRYLGNQWSEIGQSTSLLLLLDSGMVTAGCERISKCLLTVVVSHVVVAELHVANVQVIVSRVAATSDLGIKAATETWQTASKHRDKALRGAMMAFVDGCQSSYVTIDL